MLPEAQVAGVTGSETTEHVNSSSQLIQPITDPIYTSTAVEQSAENAQSGWTVSEFFGLFNILAGLMLVAAFLLFFGGLSAYLSRLGLEGRIQGLAFMYRGTSILFVLILLLAIVNYVQYHTQIVMGVLAVIVVGLLVWLAVMAMSAGGGEDEK